MGIRISMYAADVPVVRSLLERSLAETLRFHAAHSGRSTHWLLFYEGSPRPVYSAYPERGIHCGDRWYSPEDAPLDGDPFLAQTTRQYLSADSTSALSHILSSYSGCAEIEGVRLITEGHRRWWIGSFFEAAAKSCGVVTPHTINEWERRNWSLTPADYYEASRLFGNLLRDFNVEPPLPATEYGPEDIRFPIVPPDDDARMNTWEASECAFVAVFIESLLSDPALRFCVPEYFRCSTGEHDEEWHTWVMGELQALLQIGKLSFEELTVVSFID
jgi:hypothetical protein